MPTISMFYGVIIRMYHFDTQQHSSPHIHVVYQGCTAVMEIPSGRFIESSLPSNKARLVRAWIEIHQDELMANWALAVVGEPIFKIEPLR